MKERIKEIRKNAKLTQTEFGKRIGVRGNTITNYETGLRNPTDAVLLSICREFGVNEEWLRNGTGTMFKENVKDIQIAQLLGDVVTMPDAAFKRRLVSALAKLDAQGWEELEKLIDAIASGK